MEGSSPAAVGRVPRLTSLATRVPRLFLVCTLSVAVGVAAFGAQGLGKLTPFSADDPGSDSVRARNLISRATGVDPDYGLVALVPTPQGADAPADKVRVG